MIIHESEASLDRYRYDTEPMHHRTEHSIFIELLENDELHKQQKRDVESRVASSLPISGNITERCTWCPGLQQCSTGLDRNRQFWLDKDCENKNVSSVDSCSLIEKSKPSQIEPAKHLEVDYIGTVPKEEPIGASGCAVWTGYAYKYPHTASGQMLIRVRAFLQVHYRRTGIDRIVRANGDGGVGKPDIQQLPFTCDNNHPLN
ncbi:hypothetical protein HUJ04_002592 [Dendroctonus ponderosae]|nr:hypothetical protein HUJ04_002592 [Dendroctonus ponderosae]